MLRTEPRQHSAGAQTTPPRDRIIEDLGSDYDGYSNVSSIGWAA
ncbi:hypothetical protein [Streptomyces sp. SID14515]|nr:hypothetical protein [Streptomyces sp. SID14515]